MTAIGPWYLETEYNNANMAFINSIKGKSLFTEDVSDCREDICDEVRDYVNGGNDISKTNIAIAASGDIKNAVKVLHILEKMVGWPLTKVYKISTYKRGYYGYDGETNYEVKERLKRSYYVHGSRRWSKSAYMLSMYLLILKLVPKIPLLTADNTFESIRKHIKAHYNEEYVNNSVDYWPVMVKGYPKLFRNKKMQYYWSNERLAASSYSEGLNRLIKGSTSYDEIKPIFKDLVAQYKFKG
ncbi:MAG: hypothetical protein PVG39_04790 [Desulfobacteraceae bacterium]